GLLTQLSTSPLLTVWGAEGAGGGGAQADGSAPGAPSVGKGRPGSPPRSGGEPSHAPKTHSTGQPGTSGDAGSRPPGARAGAAPATGLAHVARRRIGWGVGVTVTRASAGPGVVVVFGTTCAPGATPTPAVPTTGLGPPGTACAPGATPGVPTTGLGAPGTT